MVELGRVRGDDTFLAAIGRFLAASGRLLVAAPGRFAVLFACSAAGRGSLQGGRNRRQPVRMAVLAAGVSTLLSGCLFTESYQRGYVVPDGALEQIPLGATQEQVLIVLGTPSTVATLAGDVFYYISQRTERTAFLPQHEVDRRVVAVYFDKSRRVTRLADYGLKDGVIFDFISRTTPTSGVEQNYLQFLMKQITRRS